MTTKLKAEAPTPVLQAIADRIVVVGGHMQDNHFIKAYKELSELKQFVEYELKKNG